MIDRIAYLKEIIFLLQRKYFCATMSADNAGLCCMLLQNVVYHMVSCTRAVSADFVPLSCADLEIFERGGGVAASHDYFCLPFGLERGGGLQP